MPKSPSKLTDHDPGYVARRNQLKERIAPGFWIDQNDEGHCSIEEVLQHLHMENTPENRQDCEAILRQLLDDMGERPPIYRDKPD